MGKLYLRVGLRADIIGWPVALITIWHPTRFHYDILTASVCAGACHSLRPSRAGHVVENSSRMEQRTIANINDLPCTASTHFYSFKYRYLCVTS